MDKEVDRLIISRDPAERSADYEEAMKAEAEQQRRMDEREAAKIAAAQICKDAQISEDASRIRQLAGNGTLKDEELDAVLHMYYVKYTESRRYTEPETKGTFATVLRQALH